MTFLATLKVALAALRTNKLRSALTMLGIIIGVGAVIAMVGVGAGAQARVEDQIKSLGSNLIIVLSGNVMAGGARMGAGSQPTISEDDAYALQREVPTIEAAAPQLRGSGQVVFGNSNWATSILGISPEYFVARNWVTTVRSRDRACRHRRRPRRSWCSGRRWRATCSAKPIRSARRSASATSRTRSSACSSARARAWSARTRTTSC